MSNTFYACSLLLAAWPEALIRASKLRASVWFAKCAVTSGSLGVFKTRQLHAIIYMGFYLTVSSYFDKNN
jgi:hypothetical protein